MYQHTRLDVAVGGWLSNCDAVQVVRFAHARLVVPVGGRISYCIGAQVARL